MGTRHCLDCHTLSRTKTDFRPTLWGLQEAEMERVGTTQESRPKYFSSLLLLGVLAELKHKSRWTLRTK